VQSREKAIEEVIARIGGVDFIVFDNVMSLISGDMKEEEGWRQTLPWQRSLTKRNIQVWLHTGHDETKSYGTKTREWQMDTVVFGEKVEQPGINVSFKLEFRKARERTPETRAEFENITVALVNNEWTYSAGEGATTKRPPSPVGAKFLAALVNVLAGDDVTVREGRRCATMDSRIRGLPRWIRGAYPGPRGVGTAPLPPLPQQGAWRAFSRPDEPPFAQLLDWHLTRGTRPEGGPDVAGTQAPR
jgi:hypothetical protein